MKSTSFFQIVSGTPSVTSAFDSNPITHRWWKAILWLHGKPTALHLIATAKRHIVADGFRFYARLYRFLGVLFWLVCLAALLAGVFATPRDATYWTGAGALAGAFLWLSSGLGFAGARAFREGHASGRVMLCTFMVGIIAFLAAFMAFASLSVQVQTDYSPALNLAVVTTVAVVGIGSYFIEVVYLMAENEPLSCEPDASTSH